MNDMQMKSGLVKQVNNHIPSPDYQRLSNQEKFTLLSSDNYSRDGQNTHYQHNHETSRFGLSNETTDLIKEINMEETIPEQHFNKMSENPLDRNTHSLELEEQKKFIIELNQEESKKTSFEIFQSISPKTISRELQSVEKLELEYTLNSKEKDFIRQTRNLVGRRTKTEAYCPRCEHLRDTEVKLETTGYQWCCCLSMCVLCLIPFCLLPLCIKKCYNVKHQCKCCKIPLGNSGL